MKKILQTTALLFVLICLNAQDEKQPPFTHPVQEDTTKENYIPKFSLSADNEVFQKKEYTFRGKFSGRRQFRKHFEVNFEAGVTTRPVGIQLVVIPLYILEKKELDLKVGAGIGVRIPSSVSPVFATELEFRYVRLHITHSLEWVPKYFVRKAPEKMPIEELYTRNTVYCNAIDNQKGVLEKGEHSLGIGFMATNEWAGLPFINYLCKLGKTEKTKAEIGIWISGAYKYHTEETKKFIEKLGFNCGLSLGF